MSSSLIPDVVEDKVRKRCRVRNLLVGQGQTCGGREEARPEPEEAEERFDSFLRHRVRARVGAEIIISLTGRLCLLTGRGKFSWVIFSSQRLQQKRGSGVLAW